MESHVNKAPSTFYGIQALRGVAACMVVAHHATDLWSMYIPFVPGGWYAGQAGVDIFFVISGFVMAISSVGKGEGPDFAWEFLKRRILRIVPLYWIITSVMLLKLLLVQMHPGLGHGSEHVSTPWQYVVSSYLFIPYRNSIGIIAPLLEVGWTLSFEMFFYMWFAIALALRVGVVRLLTPALFLMAVIGFFNDGSWPSITSLANPLLLEFLAGLWLGKAIQNGLRLNLFVSVFSGIAGIAGLLMFSHPQDIMRFIEWGIPAFLLIACAVTLETRYGRFLPKWSRLLGDASYSLYLSHMLSFALCHTILARFNVIGNPTARLQDEVFTVLVCLSISIPISLLLYSYIENPMNKALRQRIVR